MAKMIVTAPSGNTVNMRQSPDSTALIVAKVPVRAVVEAEASQQGWCAIQYDNKSGYMMDKFLKPQNSSSSSSSSSLAELKAELQKILKMLDSLED